MFLTLTGTRQAAAHGYILLKRRRVKYPIGDVSCLYGNKPSGLPVPPFGRTRDPALVPDGPFITTNRSKGGSNDLNGPRNNSEKPQNDLEKPRNDSKKPRNDLERVLFNLKTARRGLKYIASFPGKPERRGERNGKI
jgi:hypothetical protein